MRHGYKYILNLIFHFKNMALKIYYCSTISNNNNDNNNTDNNDSLKIINKNRTNICF